MELECGEGWPALLPEQRRELGPVLGLRAQEADQDAPGTREPRKPAWLGAVVPRDNQQAVVAYCIPAGGGREVVELLRERVALRRNQLRQIGSR